jgi:drug/metabolite transporter (DMT)-like permease
MSRLPPRSAYLVLLLCFLLWSNSFLAAHLLVGEDVPADQRLGPLAFVVARFLPVLLVTLPWLLATRARRDEARRLLRGHGWVVVLMALLSIWAYNLAFAFGQHLVAPGTAALIVALNPAFTFLLALLLRMERFAALRAAGIALAFTGVWQVIVHGAGKEVRGAYLLDALVLALAPLSWALYTLLGKRLLGVSSSPLLLTYLSLAIGSAPTLPLALLLPDLRAAVTHWEAQRFAAALFLGILCSCVGYWLWNVALQSLPASTVAVFVFLNPPLALLSAWLFLGTVPGWGLLGGGVLVLAGVWLVMRTPATRNAASTAAASAAAS